MTQSDKYSNAKSGARNPRAKLSVQQVAAIRKKAMQKNLPYGWKSEMARTYGVAPSVISDILSGRRWTPNKERTCR